MNWKSFGYYFLSEDYRLDDMQLYVNGAAKPNPGQIAVAVVGEDGTVIKSYLAGQGTSNDAEYLAVIEALKIAKSYGAKDIIVHTGSRLIINHLNGLWKNKPKFDKYLIELKELSKDLRITSLIWTGSEANPAHDEVNKLLGSPGKKGSETKLKVGKAMAPITLPVKTNYKPKGETNFTIYIEYKDKQLAVWVDPPGADMVLVKGVMRIALLELEGVDTDAVHKKMLEQLKQAEKKRNRYTV